MQALKKAAHAGIHELAAFQLLPTQSARPHAAVELGCGFDFFAARLGSDRDVTKDLPTGRDRRNIRPHPIEAAILAAVLDDRGPRPARLQRPPQVRKRGRRHIRVANDVVRLTEQFVPRESAAANESIVRVSDHALGRGAGNDDFAVGENVLLVGYRQVDSHRCSCFQRRVCLIPRRPMPLRRGSRFRRL